jgi:RNA polymerase sigma factor FliA
MTRAEDAKLILAYLKNRDPGTREAIILRYVPLVHYVLGRLGFSRISEVEYEDLISQGLLGLIDALDRYDPSFNTKFSTYASLRIRGQILDHLRALDWLSRSARSRARKVQQATALLWSEFEREPTEGELAHYLQFDLPTLRKAMVDASRITVSLDADIGVDGETEGSLHEILPDHDQIDPSDALLEKDLKSRLIRALRTLQERDQLLLSLYYFENLTMREIGEILGVSESRVCQLHGRAVTFLRAALQQYPSNLQKGIDRDAGLYSPVEISRGEHTSDRNNDPQKVEGWLL